MTQKLYTRCPHCGTVFKVITQQLAIANGKVRCGACFSVFEAAKHLVESSKPAIDKMGDTFQAQNGKSASEAATSDVSSVVSESFVDDIAVDPLKDDNWFEHVDDDDVAPEISAAQRRQDLEKLKQMDFDDDLALGAVETPDEIPDDFGGLPDLKLSDDDPAGSPPPRVADINRMHREPETEASVLTSEQKVMEEIARWAEKKSLDDTDNLDLKIVADEMEPAFEVSQTAEVETNTDTAAELSDDVDVQRENTAAHHADEILVAESAVDDFNRVSDSEDSDDLQLTPFSELDEDDVVEAPAVAQRATTIESWHAYEAADDSAQAEIREPQVADEDNAAITANIFAEAAEIDSDVLTEMASAELAPQSDIDEPSVTSDTPNALDDDDDTLINLNLTHDSVPMVAQSDEHNSEPYTPSESLTDALDKFVSHKTNSAFSSSLQKGREKHGSVFEQALAQAKEEQKRKNSLEQRDPVIRFELDDVDKQRFDSELPSDDAELQARRLGQIISYGLGSVLLVFLLGLQYLWFHRDQLSQNVQLRPLVRSLCELAGCELPFLQNASEIKVLSRKLSNHPDFPNVLVIELSLLNHAEYIQNYPVVEVRFTDIKDNLIAKRQIFPAEYLSKAELNQKLLSEHESNVVLQLFPPKQGYANFTIKLL